MENVTVAFDDRDDFGPLEGIRVGLQVAFENFGNQLAYVTSCDVPLLKMEFVSFLRQAIGDHQIAVPVDERFKHPLSAIYRTRVFAEIEHLLSADRLRPIFLFDQVATNRIHVNELKDVDPHLDSLANLNDAESYFAAVRRAGFEVDSIPQSVRSKLR